MPRASFVRPIDLALANEDLPREDAERVVTTDHGGVRDVPNRSGEA